MERYHTADPGRGRAYREKVYRRWAQAPLDGEREPSAPNDPRILTASLDPDRSPPGGQSERRKLRPLAGRGFISLGHASSRVAILRPSADRQLKPIVRPPRRSSVGLVRLTSSRRAVLALAP